MEISSQMLLFVKVVDLGSISAASRAMGQTPSAVSKQIGHLEDQVRHRLLNRTRSGVSLTSEGIDLYDKCKAVAEKFEEAEAHILSLDGHPRGRLKVASSAAFGKAQLIPRLPAFLAAYPDVQVALELTDRDVDIEEEGFDAAICFAEQRKKPDVVARKIMESRRILCAAPRYLDRMGTPESFADLAHHNCLRVSGGSERNEWFKGEPADAAAFEARGNFEGDSMDAVYLATLAGLGIARLPCYLVGEKIDSGELTQVLPAYAHKSTEIAVTFADRRNLAPKIRVFVDFLADAFREGPQPRLSV